MGGTADRIEQEKTLSLTASQKTVAAGVKRKWTE